MSFFQFKSELIDSILLIKSGIQKIIDPIAKSEGLTSTQLYVLFNVCNGNINTVGGLSRDFGVNQGNVSTLCKELEKMGLITRTRNSNDERVVNIEITSKGRETTERFDKKIDELEKKFNNISKEQISTIVKGIKEFAELLKELERKSE